ncbi:hypothetical protein PVAP13_5NG023308 [Panicum virgatum]|uniref:Uncharacterized protein n=1 Tax=Panicum virgatum TaxID=38727 RepID=A0A8T0RIW8_PANVG|nr:hypothetical protein PVAP13_5NG023308 [Panicum virgatum]
MSSSGRSPAKRPFLLRLQLRSQRWSYSRLPHGRQSHIFVAPSGSTPLRPRLPLLASRRCAAPPRGGSLHAAQWRGGGRRQGALRWPAAERACGDGEARGSRRRKDLAAAGVLEVAGGGSSSRRLGGPRRPATGGGGLMLAAAKRARGGGGGGPRRTAEKRRRGSAGGEDRRRRTGLNG